MSELRVEFKPQVINIPPASTLQERLAHTFQASFVNVLTFFKNFLLITIYYTNL